MNVKYLCYYDIKENAAENRAYPLAAANKISYIIEAMEENDLNVEVISTSHTVDDKILKGKVTKISDKVSISLPFCIGGKNIIKRIINRFIVRTQLFYNLIFKTKKNEPVIVYHSLAYMNIVKFAKAMKKFKLILEVEEIYGHVIKSEKTVKKEMKFFEIADSYIFPTELLNQKINIFEKPHTIIHGTYHTEYDRGVSFNDDKIHVVYAGTFDPRKGGCMAVEATAYLSEKYHVHIIGFGSQTDIDNIKELIEIVNSKSKATVTYDGQLTGEEYIKFLQKCRIGLSPQDPEADFNSTSFPSKILSYMSNGLKVVSINIPAIESSAVRDNIKFYEKQTPHEIAEAIMNVDLNDGYNVKEKIEKLDKKFKYDIINLIRGV